MALTAFVASALRTISQIIIRICDEYKISTIVMNEEENLINELKENRPDIIFIQATILDSAHFNIISKIKEDEYLGESFIVVTATDSKWAEYAYNFGADSFLPIPFSSEQVESVLRTVLQHPKRILIIDNEMNDKSFFIKALEFERLNVSIAKTAKEGLEYATLYFPDVFVCNINLPDMSGLELCKMIKNSTVTKHVPFFMLITDDKLISDAKTMEICFETGVHDILLPPFDFRGNISLITSATSAPKRRRKEKALVVDDSFSIRNLITEMLKQCGFMVTSAVNGEEALKMVIKDKPDIITTDYDMPVMDGWKFCMELRNIKGAEDIPVVMITSRDTEGDKKRAQLLGLSGFLNKPFTKDNLKKIIKDALFDLNEKKEKKELLKYISKDVVQTSGDYQSDKPQERFATMLFSDICSFTPLCERLTPNDVVDLLNKYFDLMIDILQSNKAVVDKLIGDAIVARFVSGNRAEDALNAAKSANQMLSALVNFNTESKEQIHIRIGINSGYVTIGNIGSKKHRLDYTMIGDNVNTAQRLESNAPKDSCLMSSSTYELIKDYIEIGESKKMTLKGKAHQVDTYVLLGIKN